MRTLPGTVAGALGKGSLSMEAAKSTDKERTSELLVIALPPILKSLAESETNSSGSQGQRQGDKTPGCSSHA